MKKILYIVPILVFAMVALTEDAKAQGQTGNASNAITISLGTTAGNNGLIAAGSGPGGTTGGTTVSANGNVTTGNPTPITVGGSTSAANGQPTLNISSVENALPALPTRESSVTPNKPRPRPGGLRIYALRDF